MWSRGWNSPGPLWVWFSTHSNKEMYTFTRFTPGKVHIYSKIYMRITSFMAHWLSLPLSSFVFLSHTHKHKHACLHTDITDIWYRLVLYIGGNDNIYEHDAFSQRSAIGYWWVSPCTITYEWKEGEREERDRDEKKVWMLYPHPLNYILSKLTAGDSGCCRQSSQGVLNSMYTSF